MKKLILFSLMFLLMAFAVSAVPDVSIDNNEVEISYSYEDLEDNDDNVSVSLVFTVRNTGTTNETVTVSLVNVESGFSLSLSDTSFSLDTNATKSVTVSGTAPVTKDSGKSTIGTVRLTYATNTTKDVNLKVDVESMLEITDLDVEVGDKSDSNVNDGDTISEEASPGDTIVLEFTVDNNFDNDFNDGDINDAELTVELDDNDFGDDIDEEVEFDVDAGEDEKNIKITFKVPEDAEEGKYTINISVKGDDDNNAEHTDSMTIKLEVEREKDDVRIDDADLGSSSLQCIRDTTLSVKIKNYGSDDQNDVSLQIDSEKLGIDEDFKFELDEGGDSDDDERRTISFTVDDDLKAGTYYVEVRVYIDGSDLQDQETVTLKVEDCPIEEEEEEVEEEAEVIVQTSTSGNGQSGQGVTSGVSGTVVESVETSFADGPWFIVLLAGLNVIGLAIVIILGIKFLF